jgi:hypothetical protein
MQKSLLWAFLIIFMENLHFTLGFVSIVTGITKKAKHLWKVVFTLCTPVAIDGTNYFVLGLITPYQGVIEKDCENFSFKGAQA